MEGLSVYVWTQNRLCKAPGQPSDAKRGVCSVHTPRAGTWSLCPELACYRSSGSTQLSTVETIEMITAPSSTAKMLSKLNCTSKMDRLIQAAR